MKKVKMHICSMVLIVVFVFSAVFPMKAVKTQANDYIRSSTSYHLMTIIPESKSNANRHLVSLSDWENTTPGEYPIDVNDEIWSELSSIETAIACDMPEEYAKKCSTENLVEYAVKYPFLMDILAFDTLKDGLKHLEQKSYLFKELFSRNDRFEKLISRYLITTTDFDILIKTNDLCISGYDSELFLEAYLGLNIGLLSDVETKTVTDEFLRKKLLEPNFVKDSLFSRMFTEAIKDAGENIISTETHYLLDNCPVIHNDEKKEVASRSAYTYCNSCGAKVEISSLFIDGVIVDAYRWISGGYSISEIQQADMYIQTHYPSFVKTCSASSKYNCHSYTWYYDSPYNQYWIPDQSDVESIASTHNQHIGNWSFGDRMLFYDTYGQLRHSANITSSTMCTSKLGHYGVYAATISEIADFYGAPYVAAFMP